MKQECKKHKWMLRDNGKYECFNCGEVVTAQTLETMQSVVQAMKGTKYEEYIPKTLKTKCVRQIKEPLKTEKPIFVTVSAPLPITITFHDKTIVIEDLQFLQEISKKIVVTKDPDREGCLLFKMTYKKLGGGK